ncbi:unnamed protein product [Colias eurytheme]|nr:unnamed protein product [Colias eurytheme]
MTLVRPISLVVVSSKKCPELRATDAFVPIRKIWEIFINHCRSNYIPGPYVTIDEQLLGFRGRCPFRMYIPNKPNKYGIKIVMTCDSATRYMIDAMPYAMLCLWSDSCAGQNRNLMVVMAYMWILHKHPQLKIINHKFMLKGHTHMEVDQIHSQIEKKKKQLKTMQIAIPRDWSQFIRTCGGRRTFNVYICSFIILKTLRLEKWSFCFQKEE